MGLSGRAPSSWKEAGLSGGLKGMWRWQPAAVSALKLISSDLEPPTATQNPPPPRVGGRTVLLVQRVSRRRRRSESPRFNMLL